MCWASACRCAGDISMRIGVSSRWLSRRPRGQRLHHPLEQHALVRDVLVDDRHPLVVDGDDEGVAELAERNHRTDVRMPACGGRLQLPLTPERSLQAARGR